MIQSPPLPSEQNIRYEYIETLQTSDGHIVWKFYDHKDEGILLEEIPFGTSNFESWKIKSVATQFKQWNILSTKYNTEQMREGYISIPIGLLDNNRLIARTNDNFYGGGYHRLWRAILMNILNNTDNTNPTLSSRVRYWLREVSALASGAYGITLGTGLLSSTSNIYVLKYAIRDTDFAELQHEASIGFALNMLRDQNLCLNFVYTYGIFSCAKPLLDSNLTGKPSIITWCREGPAATQYIAIENIPNGLTLTDAIHKNLIDDNKLVSIVMQIILSVYVAHTELYFTHWDLHTSNILLRQVPTDSILTYQFSNITKKYYIASHGYVAHIIDYGMSTAKIDKVLIGAGIHKIKAITNFGIFGLTNFYQDIYRFLIELYIHTKTRLAEFIFTVLTDIFYPDTSPVQILKDRATAFGSDRFGIDAKVIYAIIPSDYGHESINKFVDFIMNTLSKSYPSIISNTILLPKNISANSTKLLSCSARPAYCPTVTEIVSRLEIPYSQIPITVKEYYQRNIQLDPDSIDIRPIDTDFRRTVNELTTKLSDLLTKIKTNPLNELPRWISEIVNNSSRPPLTSINLRNIDIIDRIMFDILNLRFLAENLIFTVVARYHIGGTLDVLNSSLKLLEDPVWASVLKAFTYGINIMTPLINIKFELPDGHIIPQNMPGFIYILSKPLDFSI